MRYTLHKKTSFYAFLALSLAALCVLLAGSSVLIHAQTTNNPALEYDQFSGVNVIKDQNYSTGVDVGATQNVPSFLGFSNLTDTSLSTAHIKAIQSALTSRFSGATYIAIEKGNIKDDKKNKKITSRIQINRSTSQTYTADIEYIYSASASFILRLKKDGDSYFTYIQGLNNYSGGNFSIKQQNNTSASLSISGEGRERALQYIASLGYKVPDFKISFVNYRSAFE